MVRMVISEVVLPEVLENVSALARHPEPLLRSIGAYVVGTAQRAFREQGRPAGSWRPRGVPNIAGILRDFHDGRPEPVADRFRARPALIDSRDLRNSIASEVSGNAVIVGSNLPYAPLHQFGAENVETDPITEEFQTWLAAFLTRQVGRVKRAAGSEGADLVRSQLNKDLGWLLNPNLVGETLEINIPARPFLDVLPEDEAHIREHAADVFAGRVSVGGA